MKTNTFKIKKGLNIKLKGEADKVLSETNTSAICAIKPTDFVGLIPKLAVKQGDEVKAGDVLFYDKSNDKVKFTSPVSGEVAEVVRGAKRKIMEVRVLADKGTTYRSFQTDGIGSDAAKIKEVLLESGCWPFIRQRPFGVIADPEDTPKSIHISGFDTNPLGPDVNFICRGNETHLKSGVEVLKYLTSGKIHLNLSSDAGADTSFKDIEGIERNYFSGPHPAGNIGVQIHKIEPISKGDIIWYLYPQEVITIGKLFSTGHLDMSRIVALTGSQVKGPKYFKTIIGAQLNTLVEDNLEEGDNRVVSGNVLTGSTVGKDGFLGFYDSQVTVLPEGNEYKFFLTDGWLSPGLSKKRFSMSRAYPSWLFPNKTYELDTNINGEERAFVVTGQLEKVFPFDIYPMQLIKSIMVNDIDLMEKLGIYEVDAEDFALCEVVCTSKINIQEIVREGLENLRAEMA
ncbi:MAG: Na(+)-translocating NADH-quinone reductase subunit A [Saprospiraceae bacterium]|nr:Na(+)-translocating NADH-quinone reductase subunit A [Saprospiraceae bacterium]